jgi:hypothetical protein
MNNSSDGLYITEDPGLSTQQLQEIHTRWDTYDDVVATLESMGFPRMEAPPIPRPVLTEGDYINIEGEEYARTSFNVTKWVEYASVRHAEMVGRLVCVDSELSDLTAEHLNELRKFYRASGEKKPSETELKDTVKLLPSYKVLMQAKQNLTAAVKRIEVEIAAYEKYAQGLSRQLTLRGQNIDLGGKEGRTVRERRL